MRGKCLLRTVLCSLAAVSAAAFVPACGEYRDPNKVYITVDGGGANANFNTTLSMTPSESNPYPYNTLEVLAEEYMAMHEDVVITINKNSLGSDRTTIKSMLEGKEAPHLLYQITPDLLTDALNGYYVDLTDYLNQPNPYVEAGKPGAERWKDLYIEKELLATRCANGRYYNVCLEKIPIGIVYNKTYFEKNGLQVPETFGAFMQLQETIRSLGEMNPYYPIYNWYDIFLEVSVFAHKFGAYDVIEPDGFISTQELLRAYYTGEWGISDAPSTEAERMYREYIRLIERRMRYYPASYEAYDAETEFLKGNVAMIEATGGYMVRIDDDRVKDFEVGVFGFPSLSEEDSVYGGKGAYRGTAGLCTGYYVTNRAIDEGEKTVEACVDFLRFLTAPKYNDRLINDRGFGLPVSPDAEIKELFRPLVEMYQQDVKNPDLYDWNSFNSWNSFDNTYYTTFLDKLNLFKLGRYDMVEFLSEMKKATTQAVSRLSAKTGWRADNIDEWGKVYDKGN